jgi:hypothetical protein
LLGVSTENFRESKKEVVNRSMDLAEIQLLTNINESFDRNLGWAEYVVGIRSSLVKTWTHRPYSANSPGRLKNPKEFAGPIEQKAQEITTGLKKLGVEVIGDLSSLEESSYGENQIPSVIEISNLVEPILSRTRAITLDSYKSSELLVLALIRSAKAVKQSFKRLIGKKKAI